MPGVLARQPVSGIGNVYCQPPTCYCLAHQQPGDPGTDAGKANPDNTSESAFTPGYYKTPAKYPLRTDAQAAPVQVPTFIPDSGISRRVFAYYSPRSLDSSAVPIFTELWSSPAASSQGFAV